MNYFIIPGLVKNKEELAHSLISKVENEFNITLEEMRDKTRYRGIVVPRQILCYVLKKRAGLTLSRIGLKVDRDHTTVIYSINQVTNFLSFDKWYQEKIERIMNN